MSFERIRRRLSFPGVNQIQNYIQSNPQEKKEVEAFKKFINLQILQKFVCFKISPKVGYSTCLPVMEEGRQFGDFFLGGAVQIVKY